ncbi:glycosyltransferase [Zhouia amylolytica]|uniref:Glycosyltransferase family 28 n=1 Tax=Zhouia amylolytica AD3 TaxID=1286632 RepID=W2UI32_9FLAO|nr:glycosyltransferase [Zhouia amylolytica]ETN93790.1 glycosyltransferase family 28 [Zhouia amylolytica AD3]
MTERKKILVAPLNWGLGHATRCIPIINALKQQNYTPIIASDGVALELLRKEFPTLSTIELPSYQIQYAVKGKNFKLKMIWDSPKIIKAVTEERNQLKALIKEFDIDGIISDNRMGVYSKDVPSVFITHQLNVLTGNTTWLSSKIHQQVIKRFSECWVPDIEGEPNLTGKLGHLTNSDLKIKYLGPLSRLDKKVQKKVYDLMVIISGPEPQRTILEALLTKEVDKFDGKVLFVKGKIEKEQKIERNGHVTFFNFMNSAELEAAFNQSNIVLSRSGYTTVMDLAKLEKKAFFIPTPGQYEQKYLARRLDKQGIVPYARQKDFRIEDLKKINDYSGLSDFRTEIDYTSLFSLFEGK